MSTIAEVRERVAAKKAELAALVNAPCSHAEVRERIASWCRAQQAEGDRLIGMHVAGVAFGSGGLQDLFKLTPPGSVIDLAPTLIGLIGADAAAKLLDRHVALLDDGPTQAERAQRVAVLKKELFAVERAEERLIEASEAAGAPISRRADADPAAVLYVGDDEDEPPPERPRGTGIVVPKHAPVPRRRSTPSQYLGRGK